MVCKMGEECQCFALLWVLSGLDIAGASCGVGPSMPQEPKHETAAVMTTQVEAMKYNTNRKGCQLFLEISVFYLTV